MRRLDITNKEFSVVDNDDCVVDDIPHRFMVDVVENYYMIKPTNTPVRLYQHYMVSYLTPRAFSMSNWLNSMHEFDSSHTAVSYDGHMEYEYHTGIIRD